MKIKYIVLAIIIFLLINIAYAFPPPSPQQEEKAENEMKICKDTGGIAKKEHFGGCQQRDSAGECILDLAGAVFASCDCKEGFSWNSSIGCIQRQKFEAKISTSKGLINITVLKHPEGYVSIQDGYASARAPNNIFVENQKMFVETSLGNKEIKLMPSKVSQIAIDQLKLKNYEIELKAAESILEEHECQLIN